MRIMIDGMVFESEEQIRAYKERQMQALEDKFANVLGRQPSPRERDSAELAARRDMEKMKSEGWN